MAKNQELAVTSSTKVTPYTYLTGTPALLTILTPPTDGTKLFDVLFRNKTAVAKTFTLKITVSGVDYEIGDFIVPANAGNGTITLGKLSEILPNFFKTDGYGNKCRDLESGYLLKIIASADVTTAMPITVIEEVYTPL